jgi:hypothetical protein
VKMMLGTPDWPWPMLNAPDRAPNGCSRHSAAVVAAGWTSDGDGVGVNAAERAPGAQQNANSSAIKGATTSSGRCECMVVKKKKKRQAWRNFDGVLVYLWARSAEIDQLSK